jgi:hypothetical protein
LNSAQPAPINYWIGPNDSLMVSDFISNIMGGIGGWGGLRRDGTFEVRIFEAPAGDPIARFNRRDILGNDIVREQLPSAYLPPPWRWRVPYQQSWTVQTNLVGGASDTQRAFVAQPYRLAGSWDASIKADHPFAQDPAPIQAYFSFHSDAVAEASRRLDLFKSSHKIYTATLPRRALRLNLGDVIEITHERLDLAQGRLMAVVEINEGVTFGPGQLDTVTVKAYG